MAEKSTRRAGSSKAAVKPSGGQIRSQVTDGAGGEEDDAGGGGGVGVGGLGGHPHRGSRLLG